MRNVHQSQSSTDGVATETFNSNVKTDLLAYDIKFNLTECMLMGANNTASFIFNSFIRIVESLRFLALKNQESIEHIREQHIVV